MNKDFLFRKLEIKDSKEVADLHFLAFKNFFLTSLGVPFLKVFYSTLLSNKNGFGVGIYRGERLLGFAIGTINNQGLYKSLIKSNGLKMLLMALPSFIRRPSKIRRLILSLLSSNKIIKPANPCLLSICVSPESGNKGFGTQLLKEFERELVLNQFSDLVLTTDKFNNDNVNQFYKRNGYLCIDSFFQGKREMNFYYKKL